MGSPGHEVRVVRRAAPELKFDHPVARRVPRRRRVREGVPSATIRRSQSRTASKPSASRQAPRRRAHRGARSTSSSRNAISVPPTPSASTTRSARRCTCRGTDLTDVDVRVTIVHELTHALQDQHFDLTKLDDGVKTEGEDLADCAGRGRRDQHRGRLPLLAPPGRTGRVLPEVPTTATVDDRRPTTSSRHPARARPLHQRAVRLRSRYVGMLRQAGGQGRVNHAFANPPRPKRRSSTRWRPAPDTGQARGDAEVGRRRARSGKPRPVRRGASTWCWRRVSTPSSRHAAEGWGGDRYVGFTNRGAGGQECLRIAIVGDTADTDQLADAFSQWAACSPPVPRRRSGSATASSHRVRHRLHDRGQRAHARRRGHPARRPQRHRARALTRHGTSSDRSCSRPTASRPTRVGRAARRGEVHPGPAGPVHRTGHEAVTACRTTGRIGAGT